MGEHIQVEKFDLRDGEELNAIVRDILSALTRHREKTNKSLFLVGIFKDHIIARDMESGRFFKMALKRDKDGLFELGESDEVRQAWIPVKRTEKAVWSAAYVNDLPDSAFLYIAPGGKKDEEGKTVPRSLRYFPVRDADGKVDLPHVRNALARIPQAKIPQEAKDKATAAARKLLEEATKGGEKDEAEKSEATSADAVVDIVIDAVEAGAPEYLEVEKAETPEEQLSLWAGVV